MGNYIEQGIAKYQNQHPEGEYPESITAQLETLGYALGAMKVEAGGFAKLTLRNPKAFASCLAIAVGATYLGHAAKSFVDPAGALAQDGNWQCANGMAADQQAMDLFTGHNGGAAAGELAWEAEACSSTNSASESEVSAPQIDEMGGELCQVSPLSGSVNIRDEATTSSGIVGQMTTTQTIGEMVTGQNINIGGVQSDQWGDVGSGDYVSLNSAIVSTNCNNANPTVGEVATLSDTAYSVNTEVVWHSKNSIPSVIEHGSGAPIHCAELAGDSNGSRLNICLGGTNFYDSHMDGSLAFLHEVQPGETFAINGQAYLADYKFYSSNMSQFMRTATLEGLARFGNETSWVFVTSTNSSGVAKVSVIARRVD